MQNEILITGATGFIGTHLCSRLTSKKVTVLGRKRPDNIGISSFFKADIDDSSCYHNALEGIDVIIHCAARAHIMNDELLDPLSEYRKVNTLGTLNLAEQAAAAGVKRFIFVSSIKVNGESTPLGIPFQATDKRKPKDFYGISKAEAEERLLALAEKTGMEVVIIRPPLVYGPGVKANFASLLNLVAKGLPLPFACIINNKRSMVSVYNLVDLIVTCIDHPNAINQVFLVSDDMDLSTSELIRRLSQACGARGWMLPIPIFFFNILGKIMGKSNVIERLTGSLYVDISITKEQLDWKPPVTVDDAFHKTADAFLENKRDS